MISDDMTVFDIMGMMPAQQRDALVEEMEKQMGDLPDTILEQAAVSYVGTAYEGLGMDMEDIQIYYLPCYRRENGIACLSRHGGQCTGWLSGFEGRSGDRP